ncbi:hypothetical protein SAMN04489844_0760 [Nocardioides exalbidus]|uniref:Uncharacterized protein n=1 Tax=Nocardioides exalbidus TaxID=402596 RepID=A0A1H4L3C0_9ACTN|nr:hypothetical protein [Nocardioides exalbidus]SEB64855.1 hypothetical protein SAMN04489844_0760 [Nocardioides exalbidus]
MSDRSDEQGAPEQEPEVEPQWKRRRRLAAVFGDSTHEQTSDDTDAREDRSGKGDAWYREQVPPHHG